MFFIHGLAVGDPPAAHGHVVTVGAPVLALERAGAPADTAIGSKDMDAPHRQPLDRRNRRWRSVAAVVGTAVLASGLVVTTTVPVSAATGTITGGVFIDRNVNGTYDATGSGQTAGDSAFPGVVVRAFDSTGAEVGSTTVASDGTYSLSVASSESSDVRVEFTVPEGYQPTIVASPTTANSSGTTVQFVSLGARNVNLGLQVPGNYCNNNVAIAAVCLRRGATSYFPAGGVVKATTFTSPTPSTNVSTKAQVGSTWGLGYQRTTGLIWNSAMIRSHSGLGPQGIGGLYVSRRDGTLVASFDLVASKGLVLEPATGTFTDANRGIRNDDGPHHDPQAFWGVGKAGFGDLDVSVDGRYLWITNLWQRSIHRIEITGTAAAPTLGAVTTWSLDDGFDCSYAASVLRGWALEPNDDGSVKVGAVCTNEGATPTLATYAEGGVVLRLDPTQSGAAAWSTLTTVSLAYSHVTDGCGFKPAGAAGIVPCRWMNWSDDYAVTLSLSGIAAGFALWAQPMITDIETMVDGSLILGMNDRSSYQLGQTNYGPVAGDTRLVSGRVSGDMLLMCKSGAGWAQESGGRCVGDTTYTAGSGRTLEFFDDLVKVFGAPHPERVIGGLAIAPPNYPQTIASTSMDPQTINSGGLQWNTIANGDDTYDGGTRRAINLTTEFAKAAGMGDVEVLCDAAPLQIGNRIWIDADGDGVQDPGEVPVAGVTVRLYDEAGTLVGTAVTNAAGEYYFTSTLAEAASGGNSPDQYGGNIKPNTAYTLRLDDPDDYASGGPLYGYALTSTDSGSVALNDQDDAIDNDSTAQGTGTDWGVDLFPRIDVAPHVPGEVDHTLDFGFTTLVAMGDYVWIDSDRDGVQDPGEAPLAGVTVTLYEADGVTPALDAFGNPATAVTAADGSYLIDGLLPGDYRALFTPPAGYVTTTDGAGTSATDSNPDPATGLTPVFSISRGVSGDTVVDSDAATLAAFVNPTIDADFVPVVSLGDYVWFDTNHDGVQDATDVPLEGVTLSLTDELGNPVYDLDGNLVGPTTTDSNGYYEFGNLGPGTYKVTATTPTGLQATVSGAGTGATDSSDGTATSTLLDTAGEHDPTLDFGFWAPRVSVGEYVWLDLDNDGIQEAGEPPLSGVRLSITDLEGNPVLDVFGRPVGDTFTDGDGLYSFDNLPVGQYIVSATTPAGLAPTVAGDGSDPLDSSTEFATSAELTADGDRDPTLDFGFYVPPPAVGTRVWLDTDRDGLQDVNEPGIPGVTLTLKDALGNVLATTTTDADGNYLFDDTDGLVFGQAFSVAITYPPGYVPTTAGDGTNPLDSSTGTATSIELAAGTPVDLTLDFGLVPKVSVGDFVWLDTDRDGIQDAGEPGIEGVELALTNADGTPVTDLDGNPVGTVLTDADGKYLFENLPPGEYTVSVVTPPAGLIPTTPGAGSDPAFDSSTTAADSGVLDQPNEADLGLDFGFVPPQVSVGDFVWLDIDRDGVQGVGEPGIEGVELTITDADGNPVTDVNGDPVGPVTTDADGFYEFVGLPPGRYIVSVTPPAGLLPTVEGDGSSPTDDSSTDSATSADLLEDGDHDPTLDFGFVLPRVSVGDLVWFDTDADGVQDPGEPGIPGVELTITNADDPGAPVLDVFGNPVTTALTDADGNYLFADLPPGRYTVSVTGPPPGLEPTTPGAGSDPTVDSSQDSATSAALSEDGSSDPTLDFGFVPPLVAVGDRTWVDLDGDGVQDTGEPSLPGVVVELLKPDGSPAVDAFGNPVAPVTTDADGFYFIGGLLAGDYRIRFTLPEGYSFTSQSSGSDSTADSDADPATGTTPVFSIAGAVDGETIAAADYPRLPDGDDTTSFVNPAIDAGVARPVVAVANYYWFDADADGVRDPGEAPVVGGLVELLDANGNPVRDADGNPVGPVETDGSGYFFFDNLVPGTYRLRFTPPAGYAFTQKGSAVDPADSNANPSGLTDPFRVESYAAGATDALTPDGASAILWNPTVGAGLVPVVAVGDVVWIDADKDGIQDAGELPLEGVEVVLLNPDGTRARDADGRLVRPVFTDADGRYLIDNLVPGEYRIRFILPAQYTFTTSGSGSAALDSNADPLNGTTDVFVIRGRDKGNTVVDDDPSTVAIFVDPTIDAGVVLIEIPATGLDPRVPLGVAFALVGLGIALTLGSSRRKRLLRV